MWVSRYFSYFVIYSCMGWVYETIYCTIKTGKWDNRGFLYGPICPIYGVGGVGITAVSDLFYTYGNGYQITWWQVFLISYIGSVIIEYTTSWALEKLFHAYWWDYSYMPLNINGRVCVPYSIGFGCAGLLVVYVIAPFTKNMTAWISPLGYEIVGLLFMCLVSIDTTLTVSALTHFEKSIIAAEMAWNLHMDELVDSLEERKRDTAAALNEKGAKELLLHSFSSMGAASKAALRRVEGFKKPKKAQLPHMEFGLNLLKSLKK